jgi:hypothetical protein
MIQLLARASYAFSQCWHTVYEEVHAIRFSSFCVTGTSSDACTSQTCGEGDVWETKEAEGES